MVAEPVALAFANTRSSRDVDRISTLPRWRAWIGAWPGLRSTVDAEDLIAVRRLRDDVQGLLHSAARGERPDTEALQRVMDQADGRPGCAIEWRAGRLRSTAVAQHLARATIDVLLAGPRLAACAGRDCRKLFVATRPDRRWCDSTVCGNRARVRAHSARQRAGMTST
jgi:predicted RNA-binding Zn ribbon-like protein